jgi:hypothetical protein
MSGKQGCAVYRSLGLCLVALIGCGDDTQGTPPLAGSGGAGGAAGATAGTGAAGGGGASLTTCPPTLAAPAALHAAAAMALLPVSTPHGSCSFGSCHDAASKKAGLSLLASMPLDLKTQVVGKPACEVPSLMLVAAGGGNAALANSWLWLKLVAPCDSSGVITPKPEWGTAALTCSQDSGQTFGVRMPRSFTDMLLGEEKLLAVRDWICGGAPGP